MQLTDLLSAHGIEYRSAGESHHVTEGWIGLDCVFCSLGSGKFKLGYSLRGGYFTCWSCGYHRAQEVLHELGIAGKELYALSRELKHQGLKKERAQGKLRLPSGVGSLQPIHRDYLRSRGLDPRKIVQLWSVMGIGLSCHLGWRLFIPIHYQGQIVSWTTRSVGKDACRYICAKPEQEILSAKELLYGEDYCRHRVVAVEGPVDTWALGPGSVATLGTAVSSAQIAKLARFPERAICFDHEPDAQQRARELCRKLETFPGSTVNLILETGKDPGEASKQEIYQIRRRFLE